VKQVQLNVSVSTRKGLIGRIFGPVEGTMYSYTVTIKNTGDEPVGSRWAATSAYPGDVESIEFVWDFPNGQANHRQFPFPDQIAPGDSYAFPAIEHKVLSSGFGLLTARLRRLQQGLKLRVTNESGQVIAIGDSFEEETNVPGHGFSRYVADLRFAFGSFRAASRGEVYQLILITIATTALVANVAIGIMNYVK